MASTVEKLNRQFVKAGRKGDLGRLERLLAEGAEIDGRAGGWLGGSRHTALEEAASSGETEAVKFLINRGASRNLAGDGGNTPLMYAALGGYCSTVETLLQHGVDAGLRNGAGQTALDLSIKAENTCATEVIRKKADEQAEQRRQQARRQAEREAAARSAKLAPVAQKPAAPPPAAPPKPEPKKENPDIVIFRQQAGDRTLEDVFNFVSLERITLVRKSFDGPVEAMTLQGFSQIESRAFLRKAIAEHQRRGGKVTESDIFPDTKARISKLPGAET